MQIRVFLPLYPIRLQRSIIYIPGWKIIFLPILDPSSVHIDLGNFFFFSSSKSLRYYRVRKLIPDTVAIISSYVWNFVTIEIGNWYNRYKILSPINWIREDVSSGWVNVGCLLVEGDQDIQFPEKIAKIKFSCTKTISLIQKFLSISFTKLHKQI